VCTRQPAAASAVGLLSIVNERIVLRAAQRTAAQASASGAAPMPPLLPWPLWLAMVGQVEILTEMVATRVVGHGRGKYMLLAAVEAFKCVSYPPLLTQSRAFTDPLCLCLSVPHVC
jgi:hypothetical protein